MNNKFIIKKQWTVTDINGQLNTLVKLEGYSNILRARSEIIIIKDGKIFINFKSGGGYSLPGGGWNRGEDSKDAVIREAKEEVRMICSNVEYVDTYVKIFDKEPHWMKEKIRPEDRWTGYYCDLYVGVFETNYTGFIKLEDRDSMIQTGRFVIPEEVKNILNPIHINALKTYLESKPHGPINGVPINKFIHTMEASLHPDCECFGSCGRLNDEQLGCSGCLYGTSIESFIPTINKLRDYLENHEIYSIKNTGDYGINKFESGKSDSLLLISNESSTKIDEGIYKELNDLVNPIDYNIRVDEDYNVFLDRKNSIAIEETVYSEKNKYPVFIILQHNGTLLANIIKKVTKDDFSHAQLAFNASLKPMYSFGLKARQPGKGPLNNGFVVQPEGPDSEFYKGRKSTYAIYVMYVSKEQLDKMKERLKFFSKNEDNLKFDMKNLVSAGLGISSEKSKKFFCSKFVSDVITHGVKLKKVPSLYKPTDLAILGNVTLVNYGTDMKKYDPRITLRNLRKIREGKYDKIEMQKEVKEHPRDAVLSSSSSMKPATASYTYNEDSYDVANEGFLDFLKNTSDKLESWKDKLFNKKGLFGFFGKGRGRITISEGKIEIQGINYTVLRNRIKKYYTDQSIYNIFIPEYNAISYKRFEKKKIQRRDIKIDYLYTEEFFALELVTLFTDLANRFNDLNYARLANDIYENSWLSLADKKANEVNLLNTSRLENIKFDLEPHQLTFIEKYPKLKAQLNLNGYILAFEQGLGKTLTAISLSECLNVDHVYIVCPNSLKENWALEIQKYYSKYSDERLWKNEVFICRNDSFHFNYNTTRFIITNNESIRIMYKYVMSGRNMLIIDESHNFRNIGSKRVGDLITLRDKLESTDVLVMSGTPIKATPDEITPALLMIDPTFTETAAKCFSKAFKLHSSLGTSLVQARFGKIMYRKEKDVLDGKLPPKIIDTLPLTIKGSEKYLMENVTDVIMKRFSDIFTSGFKEFKELEKPFLSMSKKYTSPDMDFTRFKNCMLIMVKKGEHLHEIDQMFVEEYMKKVKSNIYDKDEKDRYESLIKGYVRYQAHCLGVAFGEILPVYRRDLYNELYDQNAVKINKMIRDNIKKTLIFTQFKGVANHIYDMLNDHGIGAVIITGDVKNRLEILKEFKENDSVLVLVATSQTLGTGVTLTEANQMFFFGPPWRDADFAQCSDRIHRIGQTDECHIYNVNLDTGEELNLSTRMDNIVAWSREMTGSVITKSEDNEDIDKTHFEEILHAEESLKNEFLSNTEDKPLMIRDAIDDCEFDDFILTSEGYMVTKYTAIDKIPEGKIIKQKVATINNDRALESTMLKELKFSADRYGSFNPNVSLESETVNGFTVVNLISTRDIKPGEELQLLIEK